MQVVNNLGLKILKFHQILNLLHLEHMMVFHILKSAKLI